MVCCSNCGQNYPHSDVPHRCPVCGGIFGIPVFDLFDMNLVDNHQPGIWKYKHTFDPLYYHIPVSLGEGNTPLVWGEVYGYEVAFKCEYLNPTGSFKDRGSATLVSFLLSRGVSEVLEDSSGNAGASLAAYTARAGIKAKIFIPDSASGQKRHQINAYGAELVRIIGPRSNSSQAVIKAVENGGVYASHAYLPFNIPGYATLAYELVEQLDKAPGTVVVPVGQGGLFIGLWHGFNVLVKSGVIKQIPKLIGVQALACSPLWTIYTYGRAGFGITGEVGTIAEGICVQYPVRGDEVIRICDTYQAELVAVEDDKITLGLDQLAKQGFYVEPTSAVVWNAMEQRISTWENPVVVVLTGNGLKTSIP